MDEVTRILRRADSQGGHTAEELLPLVYQQLRAIAQQAMNGERRGHTMQATALVHEAYLRLVGNEEVSWSSRAHFFKAAAESMRRILIEHARARGRLKRGGDEDGKPPQRVPLGAIDLASAPDEHEIVAFDDDLRRLESEDSQAAVVVRLRVFAGLTVDETAAALGVSPRTVDRDWGYARAWLFDAWKRRGG